MGATSKAMAMIALAAATLAGCSKHSPTSPGEPSNGVPGDFYALMDSSFDGVQIFSAGGSIHSHLITANVDGTPVAVALVEVGSKYVDVGTVQVGQSPPVAAAVDTLARRSVAVHGTPWFLYTSLPNMPTLPPIEFDGVSQHHFRLSGSTAFGAFADSIASVKLPVISTPAAGAMVPRDSNLVVTWSDAGVDTSIRVLAFVRSNVDSNIAPGVGDWRDPDGHATVDLVHSHLPAGSARLVVVRYRVVTRTIGQVALQVKCEGIVRRMLTLL